MAKEMIAMILAGGQGSRLYALTQKLAKPAVPFGGKYRIIDFPLSNCVNSDIDTVGILTQYQPLVLNEYIGNGQPWDLDRLHGGVHVLPPYQQASGSDWYKGTANAIYQNISFCRREKLIDQPKNRTFSAAGRTDYGHEFSILDSKGQMVYDGKIFTVILKSYVIKCKHTLFPHFPCHVPERFFIAGAYSEDFGKMCKLCFIVVCCQTIN